MMLADFISDEKSDSLPLPDTIERLGHGKYVFGITKVHLKCVNDTLVG